MGFSQKLVGALAYLAPVLSLLPVVTVIHTIAVPVVLWVLTRGRVVQIHVGRAFDLILAFGFAGGAVLLVAAVSGERVLLVVGICYLVLLGVTAVVMVASVFADASWRWLWTPKLLKPSWRAIDTDV